MVGQLLNFKTENRSEEPDCPFWLKYFLRAKFFVACSCSTLQGVERNLFCVDCAEALCAHCSTESHIQHHILQIGRSYYQNVVRIDDAKYYLDTTAIEPYLINGSEVVFVSERPESMVTPSSNPCTCGWDLPPHFRFCSIECKYEWVKCGETSFSMEPKQDSQQSKKRKQCVTYVRRNKRKGCKQEEQALPNALLECNSMERLPNLTEIRAPSMPPRLSGWRNLHSSYQCGDTSSSLEPSEDICQNAPKRKLNFATLPIPKKKRTTPHRRRVLGRKPHEDSQGLYLLAAACELLG